MDRQSLFDVLTIRLSEVTARRDVLRTVGQFALALLVFGISPGQLRSARAQGVTPQSRTAAPRSAPARSAAAASTRGAPPTWRPRWGRCT